MMLAKASTDQTVESYCIVRLTSIASIFGQHKMKWNFHTIMVLVAPLSFSSHMWPTKPALEETGMISH